MLTLVPIVNFAPWELLYPNNDNVTNNSHVISYRALSTVCFTYVKKKGEDDKYQNMTFRSNTFTLASSHTMIGINNGQPYSKTTDTNQTVYSDFYANGSKALDAYLDVYAPRSSFVKYFNFYNHDKTVELRDYVINPSFPSQITQ